MSSVFFKHLSFKRLGAIASNMALHALRPSSVFLKRLFLTLSSIIASNTALYALVQSSVFFKRLCLKWNFIIASNTALHVLVVLTFLHVTPLATASTPATVTIVQMCSVDDGTGKPTCVTCHPSTEEDIQRIKNMCFQAYDDCKYFQWLFESKNFVLNQNFLDAFDSSCYKAEIQVKTVIQDVSPTVGENKTPSLPATTSAKGESVTLTGNVMSSHVDDERQDTKLNSPEAENKHRSFLANPNWRLAFASGSIGACVLFLVVISIMIKKRRVNLDAESVDATQTPNLSEISSTADVQDRDTFETLEEQDGQYQLNSHESRKHDGAEVMRRRDLSPNVISKDTNVPAETSPLLEATPEAESNHPLDFDRQRPTDALDRTTYSYLSLNLQSKPGEDTDVPAETSPLLEATPSIEAEPDYPLNSNGQRQSKVSVLIDALERTKRSDLAQSLQSKKPGEDFTEEELRNLAGNLGVEWEELGTRLGIKKPQIDRFKLDRQSGRCEDAIFDMLMAWNRENKSRLQPCYEQMDTPEKPCRKDGVPKTIDAIVKEIKETPL